MSERKVVLVTGGTRGIGRGIAECLLADGCDVVVCGVRAADQVADTVAELSAHGGDVLYCQADIAQAADRERMREEIAARFGRLNVLVNNAGVAPSVRADILEAGEESYERVMRINLQGPYFLTQLMANWMIAQREADPGFAGCVVNVSSISAVVASPSRGEYCLSKAGMSMATLLWATRLAEYDIPVYEVRPGITATDMTAGVKEKYDALIAEGLLLQKRWGQPADTGKVVAMMVRGDIGYSTGQFINVEGGHLVPRL
jgi:NAD(P)-dependent dehydrogenase (short-subunit alcohol dehydrogenase family)